MSDTRPPPDDRIAGRVPWFAWAGVLGLTSGLLVLPGLGPRVAVFSAVSTLGALLVLLGALAIRPRLQEYALRRGLRALHGRARHPVLLTDCAGGVLWRNTDDRSALADEIRPHVADPVELLRTLRDRALQDGDAIRDIGTVQSGRRISVRKAGTAFLVWEILPNFGGAGQAVAGPARTEYERLPVPLLEIDRGGRVRAANTAARSLLALDTTETPPLSAVLDGLGRRVADWLEEAFDGRALQRPEVGRATRASGDVFVQITLDAIPGDPDRLMAILHDATELKTLEAQFVQSQKMQAIGQLAGGVAHDFNNLLTAIGGHCDLLLMRRDPTEADFADIEQINQNANRAASLVRQLLAFSRKQNLRPEPIDLRAVLADLTHLLSRLVGERVSLTLTHDPDLQLVRADKRQIEQVIMNLVVNARDAMPDGGEIFIDTEMARLAETEARNRPRMPVGTYVVVRVRDCGCGIPEDKLSKIFEPFYTTKRQGEGTGLGLSTAYGIIKQTGGYIFADSRPGEGTTFSLYFPAHEHIDTPPVPAADGPVETLTPADGVILLVEDEPPVRAFATRALRMRGFTVLEAPDGETALEIAARTDTRIDLFLSDVIMPGVDGPTWVREALSAREGTPVIFMSGYAEESFPDNQAAIPGSRFLQKPFSLTDLVTMVQRSLC